MKKGLIVVLAAGLSFGALADDNYSGFRLGAGATMGQATEYGDLGAQPRLELGYDFNRFLSVNTYAQSLRGKTSDSYDVDPQLVPLMDLPGSRYGYAEGDLNGWRAGLEVEIGYALELGSVDIKPYVAAGIATQGGDFKFEHVSNTMSRDEIDREGTTKLTGSAITSAVGVRINTNVGIYVDSRLERAPFRNRGIMKDQTQGSISVGYKF